jgi:ATP-dependent Clp protease ATP-binding subunit ClpA
MPDFQAREHRPAMRSLTDSAQNILTQVHSRAYDRGSGLHRPDEATIVLLVLWSVLLWERKVGLVALEQAGVNRFDLARDLDRLLDEKASELPDVFDSQQPVVVVGEDQQPIVVVGETHKPFDGWHNADPLEPLLHQAEHEATDLGHGYIGSEHLVLAIIKLADPALTNVLQQHGLSHGKVREAVIYLLHA